jgi:ATP phosphoribosyltransferase-like protein
MASSAVLIANKKALAEQEKKEKIYDILTLLKGVVDGTKRVHIFVNVKKENLQKLLKELPALKNPTVSPLANGDWYDVNTVIEKDCFIELLPKIRKLFFSILLSFFSFLHFFLPLPPVFEPGYNLFLISLVTGRVILFALERVGQVLLFHKVSRVIMGVFIAFAVSYISHQVGNRVAQVERDGVISSLLHVLLDSGVGCIQGIALGRGR